MSSLADEIARLGSIARVVFLSMGLPMFVCGIVGNLINALVFAYLPQFNKLSSSVFFLFSFIGSEISLLVILLPQLLSRISGSDLFANYVVLCKVRWFAGPLSATLALHCICLASINQYLITSRIIRRHRWITRRRAVSISLFVLLLLVGTYSPALVYYTQVVSSANVTTCNAVNPTFALYYTYISIVVYSLIPIFVLSLFSFLTWWNVRTNLRRDRHLEQAFTRMLFAQIVMVLLTTIPNLCSQMYSFYTRTTLKSSLQLAQENVMSTVLTLLGASLHSFTFYTYILASKPFRQNIRSLFHPRQRQIQPTIPLQNMTQ